MTYFISPRDLQRSSKKILEDVNKSKKPAIILSKKKPIGVIITYKLFEKITKPSKLEKILEEGLKEYKEGKTKAIKTAKDFDEFVKEVLNEAK